jgi:peptide/nickel transport system substrate-binding protein
VNTLRLGMTLLAIAGPVACGAADRAPGAGEAGTGAVTVVYPSDDLGPMGSAPIQYLVFLTLVRLTADGDIEGRLARSWDYDGENRAWTVRLRSDIRWHDGVPVTAHDVKFTVDLYGHPEVLWTSPGTIEVTVVDDTTYTVRYSPTADAEIPIGSPLDWYYPIYPAHLLADEEPAAFHDWDFWEAPVGNGPYRLVRRVPGTGLVLEANADFPGPPINVRNLLIRNGGPSVVELEAGNADALASIPDLDVARLAADPRFRVYHSYNLGSLAALLWNQSHGPFGDAMVRRALTFAIDRQDLFEFLGIPETLKPVDILPTKWALRNGTLPDGLPSQRDSATALLDAAGWVDSDGDGVRDRDGIPFRFSLLVSAGDGPWFPDHRREAVLIQSNLREVGIDVEILSVDPAVSRERTRTGDFEAALFDIKGGNRSSLFGPESVIGYHDPAAARLVEAARREIDRDARADLFAELGTILARDIPFTLLAHQVTWTVADRRLTGMSSPWRADPIWYMDTLAWDDADDDTAR